MGGLIVMEEIAQWLMTVTRGGHFKHRKNVYIKVYEEKPSLMMNSLGLGDFATVLRLEQRPQEWRHCDVIHCEFGEEGKHRPSTSAR